MSDYERYGDYNNIDESPSGKRPLVLRVLYALLILLLASVVGFLAFRMILFENYPSEAVDLVYTDALRAECARTDSDPAVRTQKLRFPYDDAKEGNFFADSLLVIDAVHELQITVRYNVASLDRLSEQAGTTLDAESENLFTYRLVDSTGRTIDAPVYSGFCKRAMYRYQKLAFDGVDFSDEVAWQKIEILHGDTVLGSILIYENHDEYTRFEPYRLKKSEKFR